MKKSEQTRQFILDKVAPIFNKKGYAATSLTDLTAATGLTKGAIYGNFESKEALAVEAFVKNSKLVLGNLGRRLDSIASPLAQLFAITDFYRTYYQWAVDFGGCPILNVGVDSNHHNKALFLKVNKVIDRLNFNLQTIIQNGIEAKELKADINSKKKAGIIFSMIEGSIFLAIAKQQPQFIKDMMNQIDSMIKNEMMN